MYDVKFFWEKNWPKKASNQSDDMFQSNQRGNQSFYLYFFAFC